MRDDEGRFPSASGGESYWQAWLPDTPRGVVLLVHGVSEHAGRYEHVAARLNDAGLAVYAIDHQGHGRSTGTKGNIGRMTWLVDDVDTMRRHAQGNHPGLPVFVLAHSLGGLIALDYLTSKGDDGIAGVVLTGPAVEVAVGSKIERAIAPVVSKVLPNLQVADLGIDNISRDPAVVEAYRTDPLVYTGKVRARTGAEGLAASARVQQRLGSLTVPVLTMHGSEDKLTSPSGSQLVYDGVRSKDKAVKIYDGLFHEILNEPEKDVVLNDVVSWLDARV